MHPFQASKLTSIVYLILEAVKQKLCYFSFNSEASQSILAIIKREMQNYFFSHTALVFITIFLFLASVFTFYIGDLIETGQADLTPFFAFHMYIYLFFIPAIGMKLWAEERKSETIDLLLTLPISTRSLVVGKFLASWVFVGIALTATIPIWISINILGNPDNFLIFCAYCSSFLVAGAFLSLCSYVSVHTNNQVVAFIIGAISCFIFLMTGFPLVVEPLSQILPSYFVYLMGQFSILLHYENFIKGYFEISALIYISSFTIFWIYLTELRINKLRKKGY